MWRVWHKLFGWHYASVPFAFDRKVLRVRQGGDGRPYCHYLGLHIDLKSLYPSVWSPLTFPRAAVHEAPEAADVVIVPHLKASSEEP